MQPPAEQTIQAAIRLHQAGRLDEAAALYRRALAADPRNPDVLHLLGLVLYQQGRHDEAAGLIESAIRENRREPLFHFNLGRVLKDRGNLEGAVAAYRKALQLRPGYREALTNLGNALRDLGRDDEAETAFRRAIGLGAGDLLAHQNLGTLLLARSRAGEAAACFREAIRLKPAYSKAYEGLASALTGSGRPEAMVDACRAIAALAPTEAEPRFQLGLALLAATRGREAWPELQAAVRLRPGHAEAWRALGDAAEALPDRAYALECFRRSVELDPGYANGWNSLGVALHDQGFVAESLRALERSRDLAPAIPEVYNNMGLALLEQARIEEAIRCFRRALELRPGATLSHSNLLFALNYDPGVSPAEIYGEYRSWNAQHAAPLAVHAQPHTNVPDPARRLRLGYVSPDFRGHAARAFIAPLLSHHDRTQVEVFCYADVKIPDAETARFRTMADRWVDTVGMSDAALADRIRSDGIDILVDLAGHTAGNRLLAFARRPAPVQVTWLGFGCTTGMDAMDWFLADPLFVPEEATQWFSEKILRLPRTTFAYAAPPEMPDFGPLPATANGFVTFGCFSRTVRFNDRVIALWSRLLQAVPGARLVLNAQPFACEETRTIFRDRFAQAGADAHCLDLVYTHPQPATWEAYNRLDIALDPFPHNAGTTTFEALWMGVPVVSLADRPPLGRFGATILTNAGLPEWIAATPEEYLRIAAGAASDLAALARLRAGLRSRLAASPIGDGAAFARDVEEAFRRAWRGWCEGRPRSSAPAAAAPAPALPSIAEGLRRFQAGDYRAAEAACREILLHRPADAEALHLAGLSALQQNRADEAAQLLSDAVAANGTVFAYHLNLGSALLALRRHDEASSAFRRAVALRGDLPEARFNLGLALEGMGRRDEAMDCHREALRLNPRYLKAYLNLGNLLADRGALEESVALCNEGLKQIGDSPEILTNRSAALEQLARIDEAAAGYRRALELEPRSATAHGNLLFALNYDPDISPEALFSEYRTWNARHAAPLARLARPHGNDPGPERRLRLGYCSPDFRAHAANPFMFPLLSRHDHDRFEVHCYSGVAEPDAVTDRFRGMADRWVDANGLTDDALAERIRADHIDILVDLAGHTANNRLLAFARKPAPVQVTWLGFGCTTGMDAMDWFLADARFVPEGAERWFSERILRLPRTTFAYAPPPEMPAVGPLPALETGHVTFGSFTRPIRLNRRVVEAWSEILRRVAGSRLLLNTPAFAWEPTRRLFEERFAREGIPAERLELVATSPQPATWEAYNRIDIALDPFPHNAGTTTFEALWMGVPVVSLMDRPPLGRFGAAILSPAGLGDWLAADREQYCRIAVERAGDLEGLARLRAGLRSRVAASPVCDAATFARDVEEAYRRAWRDWIANRP